MVNIELNEPASLPSLSEKGLGRNSNFNRINIITGWVICCFACTVYILTSEAGGSFWDCGEFVSSCYKIQVPHPPGAPLFVLLGRIFIVLFGDIHSQQREQLM